MQPNLPFLLAASNALLKPGDQLKWNKRLVKDVRLSLQLTEVMKIVRLTSPLPDVLRLSSPRPKLRHGRRLALLSYPNLTLNLCTFSFVLLLALLPHLPPLLTTQPFLFQGVGFDFRRLPKSFFVSKPKAQRSRAKGYLYELRQATFPEESHWSFCSPFSPAKFLGAASNLESAASSTATGPDKVVYPMLKHLHCSGMDFLLHIFSLVFAFLSFHLEDIFLYSHP